MTQAGWDVVRGPGLTALGLAAARAVESGMSDRLVDDPLAAAFPAAITSPVAFPTAWPANGTAPTDREALFLHGSRYIGLRTRFYDDALIAAVTAGIRQVVLIGVGLDTRAFRLAWPGGVAVFELDQPQVLAFKDDVLAGLGARPRCRRTSIGIDLREDWPARLRATPGFDPSRPTAWVAEGLLAYLDSDDQHLLIEAMHDASAPGSRLTLDRLVPTDSDAAGEAVRRLSDRSGLAMDALLRPTVAFSAPQWLTAHGWTVAEESAEAVAHRYDRDLADPFAARTDGQCPAGPPWLDTMFLDAALTVR